MTDEELDAALTEALETAKADIARQLGPEINQLLAKDPNGRYILLDAYTALANFRAARFNAHDMFQVMHWGSDVPVHTFEVPKEMVPDVVDEDVELLSACCERHVAVWGVASPTRCADCRRPLKVQNTKWVYGR